MTACVVEQSAASAKFRGKEAAVWQFYRDGVTPSLLDLWLTCREQCRLQYVQGWTNPDNPLYLDFGICDHYVVERAYGNLMRTPLKDAEDREQWVKAAVGQYDAEWKGLVSYRSDKQLQQHELVCGLAETVMPAYLDRWSGDFTGKYAHLNNTTAPKEWVKLEGEFRIPYLDTHLRGKRDGVFRDKRGKLWVLDTKCLGQITEEDVRETMDSDLQLFLYAYATWKELGECPVGLILNVIRRPGHRRKVDESLSDFLDRIREDVSDPKEFDHNFMRFELPISKGELEQWEQTDLRPAVQDMRSWWDGDLEHYPNRKARITKYGRCRMFNAIVRNDYRGYYKRTKPFNELEAA